MALPPWKRIDNFSVPPHQRIVEGLNSVLPATSADGGEVHSSPFGKGVKSPESFVPDAVVAVAITGALTPGGLYVAGLMPFGADSPIDPATTATDFATLITAGGGEVVYFLNVPELSSSPATHDLTSPDNEAFAFGIGVFTPVTFTDGRRLVVGIGLAYFTCPMPP